MLAKMGIQFINTSMQQEPNQACFLNCWQFVKSQIFKEFLRKKLPNWEQQKIDFSLISYPPSSGRIQKQHNHLLLPFSPTPLDWISFETPNWSVYSLSKYFKGTTNRLPLIMMLYQHRSRSGSYASLITLFYTLYQSRNYESGTLGCPCVGIKTWS